MLNVTQIIDAFGGYKEAQILLGVSRAALAEWEIKGIPAKRWENLSKIASLIGREDITVDVVRAAAPPRADAA